MPSQGFPFYFNLEISIISKNWEENTTENSLTEINALHLEEKYKLLSPKEDNYMLLVVDKYFQPDTKMPY